MTEPVNLDLIYFTNKTYYSALQSSPYEAIFSSFLLYFSSKKSITNLLFFSYIRNYFHTSFFVIYLLSVMISPATDNETIISLKTK